MNSSHDCKPLTAALKYIVQWWFGFLGVHRKTINLAVLSYYEECFYIFKFPEARKSNMWKFP